MTTSQQIPATPARALWNAHTLALVRALGPKKAQRYLKALAETIADMADPSAVVPIRGAEAHQATREAAAEAAEILRVDLPRLLSAAYSA